ncbi:GNAT family N-acetyltransferase [Herbaspirillum sp. SJZ107]|uniref:GNAT family N-acetyltransferase n=1 Tax=Herbaspirillum sp. SJZ107 TaxID=2572881 RepID=UPI001150339F|nr:GNAT family N-acetyltransferase [Herbaspirillum sp. SJZ107]TQK07307.1 RimJ/RimL family protein N-acetyltransferase [Herbaspirillum sp. SJZ107]
MHILATARLNLRTVEPGDAAFYLALLNDPAFVEQIGDRGLRTLDDAQQALLAGPIAMQEDRGHSLYVAELRDSNVPIGMCGLIKRDSLDGVDIGYAFLPAWRGQGYAFEAGVAVLGFAPSLGLRRVLAITSPNNIASNYLLRKMGMRFERFTHLAPGDAGTNLYSIDLAPRLDDGRLPRIAQALEALTPRTVSAPVSAPCPDNQRTRSNRTP